MADNNLPEPWLRGTRTDVPPLQRAILHALDLAGEDLVRWTADLTDQQLNARPAGLTPLSFHVHHIARSIDRLLTYAEGRQLSQAQLDALRSELEPGATKSALLAELQQALENAARRVRSFTPGSWEEPRIVGRKNLPTTVAGLLIHVADHTQRHVGQAVTTAKLLLASNSTKSETLV